MALYIVMALLALLFGYLIYRCLKLERELKESRKIIAKRCDAFELLICWLDQNPDKDLSHSEGQMLALQYLTLLEECQRYFPNPDAFHEISSMILEEARIPRQ